MSMHQEAWGYLIGDLKRHEGFRSKAYLDTVGVWTIGYGFTDGVRPGDTISREEAEAYLIERAAMAASDAEYVVGKEAWATLDPVRQAVIANMAYNLGHVRLSKFYETLKAIRSHDFAKAARQMRASKWCGQVKGRCHELAAQMLSGQRPS